MRGSGRAAKSMASPERTTADKQLAALAPETAARLLAATDDGALHDEIIARLPAGAIIALIDRVTYPPLKDKLVRHAIREL
jgi:hypothetical protein